MLLLLLSLLTAGKNVRASTLALEWTRVAGGSKIDQGYGVATSQISDSIYVAGFTTGDIGDQTYKGLT